MPFLKIKKATAFLVIFSLLFSDLTRANPFLLSPAGSEHGFQTPIVLPSDLGTVQETFFPNVPGKTPFLFHIQTVHANYENALKVKEIIRYLQKRYHAETVFAEGASGKLHPEFLHFFQDAETNHKMIDALAQKGMLTGVDLSLAGEMGSRRRNQAFGIESLVFYRRAFKCFKKVIDNLPKSEALLEARRRKLDQKASKIFTPEFREIFKAWEKFQSQKNNLEGQLKFLRQESKANLGLDFENPFSQFEWPQLTRLVLLSGLEKRIQREDLEKEKEKLRVWLRDKRLPLPQLLLSNQTVGAIHELPQRSPRESLESFVRRALPLGFRFRDYPNVTYQSAYKVLESEIDARDLFREWDRLFQKFFKAKAKSQKELRLLHRYQNLLLFEKLLRLELTRDEWERIEHGIARLTKQSPVGAIHELPLQSSSVVFRSALHFYRLAERREKIFYEKIQKQMASQKNQVAILVTGGFHSEGMKQIFKEKGIGYAALLPHLNAETEVRGIHEPSLYHQIMLGRAHLEAPGFTSQPLATASYHRSELRIVKSVFDEISRNLPDRVSWWQSSAFRQSREAFLNQNPSRSEVRMQGNIFLNFKPKETESLRDVLRKSVASVPADDAAFDPADFTAASFKPAGGGQSQTLGPKDLDFKLPRGTLSIEYDRDVVMAQEYELQKPEDIPGSAPSESKIAEEPEWIPPRPKPLILPPGRVPKQEPEESATPRRGIKKVHIDIEPEEKAGRQGLRFEIKFTKKFPKRELINDKIEFWAENAEQLSNHLNRLYDPLTYRTDFSKKDKTILFLPHLPGLLPLQPVSIWNHDLLKRFLKTLPHPDPERLKVFRSRRSEVRPAKLGIHQTDFYHLGLIQSYSGQSSLDVAALAKQFSNAPRPTFEILAKRMLRPAATSEEVMKWQHNARSLIDAMLQKYGPQEAVQQLKHLVAWISYFDRERSGNPKESRPNFYKALRGLRYRHYRSDWIYAGLFGHQDPYPDVTYALVHLGRMILAQREIEKILPENGTGPVKIWKENLRRFLARPQIQSFLEKENFLLLTHEMKLPSLRRWADPDDDDFDEFKHSARANFEELLENKEFLELVSEFQELWKINIHTENPQRGKGHSDADKFPFLRQFPDGRMQSPLAFIDYYSRVALMVLEDGEQFPDIHQPAGTIHLSSYRNPLLKKSVKFVQPVDIHLDADHPALLLSGPNMGGKTMTARGIGVAVLRMQMGLPLPADFPKLGIFKNIYTIFPQPEQLQAGYGYFTGLIRELTELLKKAGRGDLILLDEVPTGTDYSELVAVTSVLLEDLIRSGATVAVTGHLKKAFEIVAGKTNQQPWRHTQNYKLEPGIAKHSHAIDLMAAAGFPAPLQELARAYYEVIIHHADPSSIPNLTASQMGKYRIQKPEGVLLSREEIVEMVERTLSGSSQISSGYNPEALKRLLEKIFPARYFVFSHDELIRDILQDADFDKSSKSDEEISTDLSRIQLFAAHGSEYLKKIDLLLASVNSFHLSAQRDRREPSKLDRESKEHLLRLGTLLQDIIRELENLKEEEMVQSTLESLREIQNRIPELSKKYFENDLPKDEKKRQSLADDWQIDWEGILGETVRALTSIDRYVGIAQSVLHHQLKRPVFSNQPHIFHLKNSKPFFPGGYVWQGSPFVPEAVEQSFEINPAKPGLVLAGPNSSGKSVLMFNAYINALLARNGLFVSGDLEISRFRSLYVFFGGRDDMAAGESYFLNILKRHAWILRHAGPESLVILDELHGSDHFELAAIEAADLQGLRTLGATVVFNTHIRDGLKILDQNAGLDFWKTDVDFDPKANNVTPFYTVSPDPDLQAKSHGLAVARPLLTPDQYDRALAIHAGLLAARSELRKIATDKGEKRKVEKELGNQLSNLPQKFFSKIQRLCGFFTAEGGKFVVFSFQTFFLNHGEHFGEKRIKLSLLGGNFVNQYLDAVVAYGVVALGQEIGFRSIKHGILSPGNSVAILTVFHEKLGRLQFFPGKSQAAFNQFLLLLQRGTPSFRMVAESGERPRNSEAVNKMGEISTPYLAIGSKAGPAIANRTEGDLRPRITTATSVSEVLPPVPLALDPNKTTVSNLPASDWRSPSTNSRSAARSVFDNKDRKDFINFSPNPLKVYQHRLRVSKPSGDKFFPPRSEVRQEPRMFAVPDSWESGRSVPGESSERLDSQYGPGQHARSELRGEKNDKPFKKFLRDTFAFTLASSVAIELFHLWVFKTHWGDPLLIDFKKILLAFSHLFSILVVWFLSLLIHDLLETRREYSRPLAGNLGLFFSGILTFWLEAWIHHGKIIWIRNDLNFPMMVQIVGVSAILVQFMKSADSSGAEFLKWGAFSTVAGMILYATGYPIFSFFPLIFGLLALSQFLYRALRLSVLLHLLAWTKDSRRKIDLLRSAQSTIRFSSSRLDLWTFNSEPILILMTDPSLIVREESVEVLEAFLKNPVASVWTKNKKWQFGLFNRLLEVFQNLELRDLPANFNSLLDDLGRQIDPPSADHPSLLSNALFDFRKKIFHLKETWNFLKNPSPKHIFDYAETLEAGFQDYDLSVVLQQVDKAASRFGYSLVKEDGLYRFEPVRDSRSEVRAKKRKPDHLLLRQWLEQWGKIHGFVGMNWTIKDDTNKLKVFNNGKKAADIPYSIHKDELSLGEPYVTEPYRRKHLLLLMVLALLRMNQNITIIFIHTSMPASLFLANGLEKYGFIRRSTEFQKVRTGIVISQRIFQLAENQKDALVQLMAGSGKEAAGEKNRSEVRQIEEAVKILGWPEYSLPKNVSFKEGEVLEATEAIGGDLRPIKIGKRRILEKSGEGLASVVYLAEDLETGERQAIKFFGNVQRENGFAKFLVDAAYSLIRAGPFAYRRNPYAVLAAHLSNQIINQLYAIEHSKDPEADSTLTPPSLYVFRDPKTGSFAIAFPFIEGRKVRLPEPDFYWIPNLIKSLLNSRVSPSEADEEINSMKEKLFADFQFLNDLGFWGLARQVDARFFGNWNALGNGFKQIESKKKKVIDIIPGFLGGLLLPFEAAYLFKGLRHYFVERKGLRFIFPFADAIDFAKLEGFVESLKTGERISADQEQKFKEEILNLKEIVQKWQESEYGQRWSYRKWFVKKELKKIGEWARSLAKKLLNPYQLVFWIILHYQIMLGWLLKMARLLDKIRVVLRIFLDSDYRKEITLKWVRKMVDELGAHHGVTEEQAAGVLSRIRQNDQLIPLLFLYPVFMAAQMFTKTPVPGVGTFINVSSLVLFVYTLNPIYLIPLFADGVVRAIITFGVMAVTRRPLFFTAFFSLIPSLGLVIGPSIQIQKKDPELAALIFLYAFWKFGTKFPGMDAVSWWTFFWARLASVPLSINQFFLDALAGLNPFKKGKDKPAEAALKMDARQKAVESFDSAHRWILQANQFLMGGLPLQNGEGMSLLSISANFGWLIRRLQSDQDPGAVIPELENLKQRVEQVMASVNDEPEAREKNALDLNLADRFLKLGVREIAETIRLLKTEADKMKSETPAPAVAEVIRRSPRGGRSEVRSSTRVEDTVNLLGTGRSEVRSNGNVASLSLRKTFISPAEEGFEKKLSHLAALADHPSPLDLTEDIISQVTEIIQSLPPKIQRTLWERLRLIPARDHHSKRRWLRDIVWLAAAEDLKHRPDSIDLSVLTKKLQAERKINERQASILETDLKKQETEVRKQLVEGKAILVYGLEIRFHPVKHQFLIREEPALEKFKQQPLVARPPPHIVISILVFNGWKDTEELLESLSHIETPNVEVVILDNGSAENHFEELSRFYQSNAFRLTLMRSPVNLGFDEGHNVVIDYALDEAFVDYINILNNDVIIDKHFLDELLPLFEKPAPESSLAVGSVGPVVFHMKDDQLTHRAVNYGAYFLNKKHAQRIIKGNGMRAVQRLPDIKEVDFVPGPSLMYATWVLRKIGFYDPRFFAYYEETDMGIRLEEADIGRVVTKASRIWHRGSRSSGGGQSFFVSRQLIRNLFLLIHRHASLRNFDSLLRIFFRILKAVINNFRYFLRTKNSEPFLATLSGIFDGLRGKFDDVQAGEIIRYSPKAWNDQAQLGGAAIRLDSGVLSSYTPKRVPAGAVPEMRSEMRTKIGEIDDLIAAVKSSTSATASYISETGMTRYTFHNPDGSELLLGWGFRNDYSILSPDFIFLLRFTEEGWLQEKREIYAVAVTVPFEDAAEKFRRLNAAVLEKVPIQKTDSVSLSTRRVVVEDSSVKDALSIRIGSRAVIADFNAADIVRRLAYFGIQAKVSEENPSKIVIGDQTADVHSIQELKDLISGWVKSRSEVRRKKRMKSEIVNFTPNGILPFDFAMQNEEVLLPAAQRFTNGLVPSADFVTAVFVGGIGNPHWRPEIRKTYFDYLHYLAENFIQKTESKTGIDWEKLPQSLRGKIEKEPMRILAIYNRRPEINNPVIQVLIEVLARNPFAYLSIQLKGVETKAADEFRSDLHNAIFQRRKKLSISNKGINLDVSIKQKAIPRSEFSRLLIIGEELKEADAMLQALDRFVSLVPASNPFVTASDLLSRDHQKDALLMKAA